MLIQRLGIFCNFITGGKVTVEPASAGEAALAGGQTTFPRPSLAKRASSEMTVVFGIVLRPAGRSPEVRDPHATDKK